MASLLTCVATGVTWCFCTATASLLSSCCGNDKPSSEPPSATSGRKRSVLLLVLTIAIAFAFQYGVGPYVTDLTISNYVTDAWTDGCTQYDQKELQQVCVGNNGVYRATSSALLFFALAAIAACCKPTANREAWPAKYVLFIFLTLATCFIPNEPLFSDIYLNIARIGGILFILVQQIIILDLAYNWNDSWVEKANQAEDESTQKRWLGAILASCALLFTGSIIVIGLLYHYFGGCATNTAFVIVTLVLSIVLTFLQLSGEEGSLLSSATICAYGTYLCYTAVTKNPDEGCNPTVGENNILGIVLGVGITIISLAWTSYSYTAEKRIHDADEKDPADIEQTLVPEMTPTEEGGRKVQGVVTGSHQDYGTSSAESTEKEDEIKASTPAKPVSWRINLILAVISCWIAMALTGWGSIQAGGNAANPNVSRVSMWMIVASQWIMFSLYAWSLVAPRLFPDRDFS